MDVELAMYYQPIICLNCDQIAGCEALLRVDGNSPVEYLSTLLPGALIEVTDLVVNAACDRLSYWHQFNDSLWVSVNLSSADLADPNLITRVCLAASRHGAPTRLIHLEISETTPIDQRALDTLHRLRDLGFRLALDDFGASLAGLDRLAAFEWDLTKIDKSLLPENGRDWRYSAVIDSLGALCRELGGRLCCEGIESQWQADQAKESGCELGQGWLWYPALPADQILSHTLIV